MNELEQLLTVAEAAGIIRVAPKTILNLLSRYKEKFRKPEYQRFGSRGGKQRVLASAEIQTLRGLIVK